MKTTIRIFLVGAVVLVTMFGVWSGVQAEKGSSPGAPAASLSELFAPLFQPSPNTMDDSTEMPAVTETSQVLEDHPEPQEASATPEATDTPEAAIDNQEQNQPVDRPEAHDGELTGTVSSIDASSVTINGQVFQLGDNTEGAGNIKVGETVKVEFVTNADGTISVREIKVADQSGSSGDSNQSGNDSSGNSQNDGGSNSGSGGHDGGGSGGGGDGGGGGG